MARSSSQRSNISKLSAKKPMRRKEKRKNITNVFQEDPDDQMDSKLRRRTDNLEDLKGDNDRENTFNKGDEDDDEIDSDDAFDEDDEETFEHFKFRGSMKSEDKKNNKKGKKMSTSNKKQKGHMKEISLAENEDDDSGESQDDQEDEQGNNFMDISELLGKTNSDHKEDEGSDGNGAESSSSEEFLVDNDQDEDDQEDDRLDHLNSFIDSLPLKRKAEELKSEAPRKRKLVPERTEAHKESEFNITARNKDGSKQTLEIKDVLASLEGNRELADVAKSLKELEKGGRRGKHEKPLSAPLAKRQQDQLDREAAYKQTKDEITQWQPIIQKNREADHLVFPLNEKPSVRLTHNTLAAEHVPSNSLEKKIDAILRESGAKEKDIVMQENELAMNKLTPEEVQVRRDELREMRALMFREEMKAKRIAKIKSRTYRKINKQKKERSKLSLDALMELDPEQAKIEELKLEQTRAKERMTMRHKNTGKWAKNMKRFASHDEGSREAVLEQLQRSEALERKIHGVDEHDQSFESASESDDESTADTRAKAAEESKKVLDEKDDPAPKGLFAMKFMKDAMERQRKRTQKDADDFVEELEQSGSDNEVSVKEVVPSRRGGIMSFGNVNPANAEHRYDQDDNGEGMNDVPKSFSHSSMRTSGPLPINGNPSDSFKNDANEDVTNPWLAAVEEAFNAGTRSNTKATSKDKASKAANKLKKQRKDVEGETPVLIDVSKTIKSKVKVNEITIGGGASDDDDLDHGEINDDPSSNMQHASKTSLSQRELVKAAFANDNVVDDFAQEKQRIVDEDAPKDEDVSLPGWGSWSGAGMKKKKNKKVILKHTPGIEASERQDAKLKHVIINEKKVKKSSIYLTDRLPHPFESWAQYERTLSAPIGGEWNTRTTFQALTKPRIITKLGQAIEPIQK